MASGMEEKTVGLSRADSTNSNKLGTVMSGTNAAVAQQYGETQRGLSPRHVQLMAIGGSIGTGLWVGIGGVLSKAGPLSLVLGYTFWGLLFIWPLNLSVAEMCAYLPIRGTIFELASRFVDPALGFAMGWTYFFAGLMLVCTEYSAVATVIQYWNADINPAAWIAVAMVSCVAVNLVAVKYYGESEFIMASTKVILLIGLCLITLITMSGGNPMNDAYGFRNWGDGNYIHAYFTDGSTGRFLGFWKVVIYAAFTIAGPDMIALAAGEIQNPRRTIPRVAKLIFYRLVGFYVVGVLCVGIICSSRDPGLLGAIESGEPGAGASPWVVGIKNLHIKALPDIINAFILLSGWSCGNAYLYSTSRTLYGLARDGQAPKFLLKCTKAGVPIYSVLVVTVISCITFLVSSNSAVDVFFWFVDLTTTALIMTYTFMLITYMGFYRARMAQNFPPETLPYLSPWTPYFPGLALLLGILALIFVGFDNFYPFSVRGFITSYFGLIFGVVTFLIWKVLKRTRFVHPKEADLISGKAEVDAECRHWEEGGIEETRTIPSSAPGAAGLHSEAEAEVDTDRVATTISATVEANAEFSPFRIIPSNETSASFRAGELLATDTDRSDVLKPDVFDFSDMSLVCTINADDIANRWLNNFVPIPGQLAKNYSPSISAFIQRILESYVDCSIRGRKVPPFVHWSQITLPSSQPLSNCLRAIRSFGGPDVAGAEAVANELKVEMARLYSQHASYDDMALLAAFQTHLIYAMVIFFKFGKAYHPFLREAMMSTQDLACAVAKKGLTCVSGDEPRPRWECWIAAEAKRRTLFTMCLFDSALMTHDGLSTHLATELRGLSAPASKALWETRTRRDWRGVYDLQRAEWPDSWLAIDELWPVPGNFSETEVIHRRTRVKAWLEDLDEFGTMIYAVTSGTHGT
ncbi:amino acid permease [Colletotrichum abscissum]|uniref:amino acid permease n=1 Tax=Colletotrichum abscissum TaxID=1671311 RepID=UPI0027D63438|nr:amino acid permease [Colletotrichum abscissum]KAK1477059.1 amino acid permease [Colletotrichum abscissum]